MSFLGLFDEIKSTSYIFQPVIIWLLKLEEKVQMTTDVIRAISSNVS